MAAEANSQEKQLLSSVKNALRLLRSFSIDEPEKKVTDLSASLGIGKSTVSRLLSTLSSEGFVMKDPETQKYRLGLSILHLNTILTSNLEINQESSPILKELVHSVSETAHIAVLEGNDVVYINRMECKHPVQILSYLGRRNPLHCTSSGKIILANQSEEFIDYYIDIGLKRVTSNSIIDPIEFKNYLKVVKEQGYATSIEELREGVVSIASPIRDYTGKISHAVTVVGPKHRMDPNSKSLITKVKRAASEISESIGYWKH